MWSILHTLIVTLFATCYFACNFVMFYMTMSTDCAIIVVSLIVTQ